MRIPKTITPTQSNARKASAPAVAALWFGIQLVWGAVLGIALQARCAQLAGSSELVLFGWVATSGAIAAAITQLLVGPWSDRVRIRSGTRSGFYAAGVACAIVTLPLFFLANSALWLLVTFVVLEIALNVAIGPYQAIVPDTMPDENIGIGSAWIAGMQSAGNAAGAVLAAVLGSGLTLGIAIAAILALCAALTLRHLRGVAFATLSQPSRMSMRGMVFADLFISRAFVYVGFYTLVGYVFFFIRDSLRLSIDPTRASGVAILIFTLVGSAGAALAARPAARLDERFVVFTGAALTSAALVAIAIVHTPGIFGAGIVIAGIGWGVFLCADWALACRMLPRHAMAGAMALWNLAILVPQMAAPVLTSSVLGITGRLHSASGPGIALAIAGIEMLIGALWIWRLPKKYVGN